MVAIASPSVLVCSVTAVTSSNMVTSRLMVRPSVADLRSLLLCPQLHRARRDGCCTRDAAIADLVRQRSDSGAPSGVDLHVAARPPHTHQDIPIGFVARRESILGIHLYITFEQFGDTSAATPLAAAARNTHAMRFRDLEQSLTGGHNAHLAGTRELDRTLQWWRALHCGAANSPRISEALPVDALGA